MLRKLIAPRGSRRPAILPVRRQDFTYEYTAQTVHYSVWVVGDAPIKTILFLGTVQIGRLPEWIAKTCPAGTVVVQGAPHWLAKSDGSDTWEFMYRFTAAAFSKVVELYQPKMFRLIVESQAVPGILRVLADHSAYISKLDSVVLLQPLGFNAAAFGQADDVRIEIFKRRIMQNLRHQLPAMLHDARLRYNHWQMLRTVGFDNVKSNAQYSRGLASDVTTDLKKLVPATRIAIICGSSDKLFPPSEIRATLQAHHLDIPLIMVPAIPHSPLATKQGMKLLRHALREL